MESKSLSNCELQDEIKREKAIDECQDRISELPDEILFKILSFMSMKDVVKTGVLSRRWEHLWTNVQFLCFNGPSSSNRDAQDKFVNSVNHTLLSVESNIINEFVLEFVLSNFLPENISGTVEDIRIKELCLHIDKWIRFMSRKKVEYLVLDFCGTCNEVLPFGWYPYKLPCYLLINDTINVLQLYLCRINAIKQIQWTSLKKLTLTYMELNDELIQNILNGSPLLETLHLEECEGIKNLSITSSTLRYLILMHTPSRLELSAPYIQELYCIGDLANYYLINVSSLVNVQVFPTWNPFDECCQAIATRFLESVRHAKKLKLSTRFIQVVSMLEVKTLPTPSTNNNYLVLESNLTKWDLPGIVSLLRSSPNLEELYITKDEGRYCKDGVPFGHTDFDETNYLNSMLASPCRIKALWYVVIYNFSGRSYETALVKFLLMKSPVLEQVCIRSTKQDQSDEIKLHNTLSSVQKASPCAEVLFF